MPLLTRSLFGINISTGILCRPSEAHPGALQCCAAWALSGPIPTVSSRNACQDVNVIPCHLRPLFVKVNEKHNSWHLMCWRTFFQPASFKVKVCRMHKIPFTAHLRCINNPEDRNEQKTIICPLKELGYLRETLNSGPSVSGWAM